MPFYDNKEARQRIFDRAFTQRIYLLKFEEKKNQLNFNVRGARNIIYNLKLSKNTCTCDCPFYDKNKIICKHILFVIYKIASETTMARNLCFNENLYDENFYNVVRNSIIDNFNKIKNKDNKNKDNNKKEIDTSNAIADDYCTICYEDLNDDLFYEKNCRHLFHQDCIDKWLEFNKKCPLCRTPIILDRNENTMAFDENTKIKLLVNKKN